MTCIVGLVHDGDVYIAGDSAGVSGYDLRVRADEKVFQNGHYAFGFTSSFRMGQLIRYAFTPPAVPNEDADLRAFMTTTFVDALRECLKKGGYAKRENEVEAAGVFLVGVHGRLFVIESDYQVGENVDGFAAVGCGDQVALGSLYTTRTAAYLHEPEYRVRAALEAAERFSAGVRGPFVVTRIPAVNAEI